MQIDPRKSNLVTPRLAAASSTLTCMRRFSEMKSAGYVLFARMPPTLAAAITTVSGLSGAEEPVHGGTVPEVQLRGRTSHELTEVGRCEVSQHGASYKAAVPRDEGACTSIERCNGHDDSSPVQPTVRLTGGEPSASCRRGSEGKQW